MSTSDNRWLADALLVIDMQNSFLHPEGGMYAATGAPLINIEQTVLANRRAVEAAQAVGVPVVYTRHGFRPGYEDAGLLSLDALATAGTAPLVSGTWDCDVVDELPVEGAHFVDKARMDAFYNTSLELLLRGLHATHLAVSGVVTNACVETTTRSAAMRDFEVTVLSDCVTTFSTGEQAASLSALENYRFAHVREFGPDLFPVGTAPVSVASS
jgi:nicotinamidase-related amidase